MTGLSHAAHIGLPDGRQAWECSASSVADVELWVKEAAQQVFSRVEVTAFEQRGIPAKGSELVTLLSRHPGGATVCVHARSGKTFTIVADAVVTGSEDVLNCESAETGSDDACADPAREVAAAAAAQVLSQQAVTDALGADVPPRDAAERVTFATWAIVTGASPGGIFSPLPALDEATAAAIAERLAARTESPISAEQVVAAATIEELASTVRGFLEAGQVDGFVRMLRAREAGSHAVPVFVFHPAGGSTVVYEPLLNRLPAATPMYGFERVEGTIQERAAQYVPKLLELQDRGPFVLAGWSLGGALAYACAIGLTRAGADVDFVGLIDTVHPAKKIPQTRQETRARWDRYARFAERTFNVQVPEIPYEYLESLDEDGQIRFVLDAVQSSGVQIPIWINAHWKPPTSNATTGASPSTWPTAITTTRYSSNPVTPHANPTAAGNDTSPISKSSGSAASTSKRSMNPTSPPSPPIWPNTSRQTPLLMTDSQPV
jgi:polyketide synthase 13